MYDPHSGKKIRKTFHNLAEARGWRHDAAAALRRGTLRAPGKTTLREAAEAWLEGAEQGEILSRNRTRYKPSSVRGYRADLTRYVLPELGALRLDAVSADDFQGLVDRLAGGGLSASKVRNILVPVQALYRRHRRRVPVNPTEGLELPAVTGGRERAASVKEAAELIAALPESDRALWATAFYAGLRRGELRALRWDDVDLASGEIHVRASWDDVAGFVSPKSRKGRRDVPIVSLLRDYLLEHKARAGRDGAEFVFGPRADHPFTPTNIRKRALTAWSEANAKRREVELPELVPIGLHECRHTCVSLLFDAGLSLERIGDYVGHSSSYMTEAYRHLIDGHKAETVRLVDAYVARASTQARAPAQV